MVGDVELGFCPAQLGGAAVKTEHRDSSTFARTVEYPSGLQSVVVPVVTLVEEFPYDIPIRFLKIDAECYKPQVLAGTNRLMKHRCIDSLMLEAVPEVAGDMWPALLDKINEICSLGYESFTVNGDGTLRPTNVRGIANGCGLNTRNVILKAIH